ncbi:DUF1295 domain-containing protein [Streptosporangium sp. NPDC087985]|uniref:DUF1295 domain-containing protein n=1 Tax=Streptosporangium sp. NPDC087985 TaxID=3366196 RepID=UPI003829C478
MSAAATSALVLNLVACVMAVVVLMGTCLAVSAVRRDWSTIDVLWGLGFVTIAVASFALSGEWGDDTRRILTLAATSVWGLRLACYLLWRNRAAEDPRYTALLRRNTGPLVPYVIRSIFWPQGRTMVITSLPIQVAMYQDAPVSGVTWVGLTLAAVGITLETVGDAQLARFKSDPANAGRVMDRGLWGWTRHPNYFGDSCVMFGLWLMACGHWLGMVTLISPVYMTYRLIRGNGKALTERRMAAKRGQAYLDYVERTSGFFPVPPSLTRGRGARRSEPTTPAR